MEESEANSWKQLINKFLADDYLPFFEKLKFIVIHHRYFRGKTLDEICKQYGMNEPEDFLLQIFLEIYEKKLLEHWKDLDLSETQVEINIHGLITHRIIDKARKYTVVTEEINDETEDRRNLPNNEKTKILDAVREKLNSRQKKVLYKSKNLGIGEMTNLEVAAELEISVKTIEKDIRKIKDLVSEEAIKQPYLNKVLKAEQVL